MLRIAPTVLSIVIAVSAVNPARAQLSDSDRARLVGEIRVAAQNLDPELFPDLEQSQSQVMQRVAAVHRYFDANTDPANRAAWLDYLDLDPLVKAIDAGDSPAAMARQAVDVRYRLVGTAPGLELTVLRNLRDSVEQLVEAIRFRNKERSVESLSRQLDTLADRVGELDATPSADDFAAISVLTGVLASSGQADHLVNSLRNTFNRPNAAILIGASMVQTAVYQDVNEQRSVRDCIMGTRIVGNASMTGAVTANLLPSVGAARVNVRLVGHIVSRNVGYNGPVKLRTMGTGDVTAMRNVTMNESGVNLEPAYVQASLQTQILAIEHKLRLVRKIAWKKAGKQKPKADRLALQKLREQVCEQFVNQTNEATSIAPPDVMARVRPVLKRLSLAEPTRSWGSTEHAVCIDSTFRRHDQLGSIVSRPAIDEPYDAAIQIHESVIDNAAAPVLAGRTLNESELNDLLEKSGRDATTAEAGEDEEPEPPFEIDFARVRPVIFEARDQTLRVGVRGTRFAQGNRELKRAMEITAVYEPARTDDGVVMLLRKGDVDVDFPGGKRLTVSQAGLKRTIQKKFSDVFPETVLDKPLKAPGDVKLEAIKDRAFHPRMVDAKDGWLSIAIR